MKTLTLGQRRELFARCLAKLILKANELGYEFRLGELERKAIQAEWNASHCRVFVAGLRCELTPEASIHNTNSGHAFRPIGSRDTCHGYGLAIDGYLRKSEPRAKVLWETEHYRELGEYWESLHPLCYWGGRTDKPGDRLKHDGGHFSITYRGIQ